MFARIIYYFDMNIHTARISHENNMRYNKAIVYTTRFFGMTPMMVNCYANSMQKSHRNSQHTQTTRNTNTQTNIMHMRAAPRILWHKIDKPEKQKKSLINDCVRSCGALRHSLHSICICISVYRLHTHSDLHIAIMRVRTMHAIICTYTIRCVCMRMMPIIYAFTRLKSDCAIGNTTTRTTTTTTRAVLKTHRARAARSLSVARV